MASDDTAETEIASLRERIRIMEIRHRTAMDGMIRAMSASETDRLRSALQAVKTAIEQHASDMIWVPSSCPETVCDFIDGALSSGGTERPDAVRITAAAICQGGTVYQLPPPARHHDIIRHMIDVVGLPPPVLGEQGFVTSDGRFLPRLKAFVVAKDAGQIVPGGRPTNLLFSEDLW